MPVVRMPDGTQVRFPDEMPKEQIRSLIASKFPEAVPQQAEQPEAAPEEGFDRAMLLPMGRDRATGEVSMAVPGLLKGLFEGGKSAVTAPGRAMSGELPVMGPDGNVTPEAIADSTNFALFASPTSPASGTGKLISVYDDLARGVPQGQQVAGAASRLGVELPRAVTSDSMAVQSMGKIVSNVPIGGVPLKKASEKAISQLDDAAQRVQQGYGSGSVANAGSLAREGMTEYAKKTLPGKVSARYDTVDKLVTPNVTTRLENTAKVATEILGRRGNAKISGDSKAVRLVSKALNEKNGLNYQGIKDLRTSIGEIVDDPAMIANSGMSAKELGRIYSALSDDLRNAVNRAGGEKAGAAFEQANTFAAKTFAERDALQKVIGKQTSDEGIFAKIEAMAGSTSRADQSGIMKVRRAVGKETWDEISSAVIGRMGRDATGNFTPDRFLTAYGKLSPTGKAMLFRSTGKKGLAESLDDLAKVSSRFKELNKFANPSGTGQTVIGGSYLAGALLDPMTVVGTVGGTNIIARVLAKPQVARSVADYAKAYELAVLSASPKANQALALRAKALANALANDAGQPALANQIFPAISTVRKVPAQPEQGNQRGAEGQDERPANQPRMLAPNEI